MELLFVKLLFASNLIYITLSAPQQPEINDQFNSNAPEVETSNETVTMINVTNTTTSTTEIINLDTTKKSQGNNDKQKQYITSEKIVKVADKRPNAITLMLEIVARPIAKFISTPKVNFVIRNVGTCFVNGVMEIIAYYFPAPFIPLIASAAGMVIPFEPVVMLKEKMPVTSYRRAFRKAMSSFLNTFDGYKVDNYDEDPYMTRRFNRRFMNNLSGEKKEKRE